MKAIESLIFYTIEKTIKTYRQHAQREFVKNGLSITIDQWLVLSVVNENRGISQKDLAAKVFKDAGSITRIIQLLEKQALIGKNQDTKDKRKAKIFLTKSGSKTVKIAQTVALHYRKSALKGISSKEVNELDYLLNNIIANC